MDFRSWVLESFTPVGVLPADAASRSCRGRRRGPVPSMCARRRFRTDSSSGERHRADTDHGHRMVIAACRWSWLWRLPPWRPQCSSAMA